MTYTISLTTYSDYETDDKDERKAFIQGAVQGLIDKLTAEGMTVSGTLSGHGISKSYSATP